MDVKQAVLQTWQKRADRTRDKLTELEKDLAYQQYELEIAQRVLAKAQSDAERETWQTQVSILEAAFDMIAYEQDGQRKELALCAAVIAEIEADLAANRPE